MLIGYARVSTNEQDTTSQASALKNAGCERIFREKATGGRWNRPELQRLLDHLRKGDVLVVWKLDRLSRSLRDVLTIMERIQEAKAGFRSLTEAIDTTTPAGRMMMQMIGSFAEFERAMLRERTRAGLESARDEGRISGRRPKLLPQQQRLASLKKFFHAVHSPLEKIASTFIGEADAFHLDWRLLPGLSFVETGSGKSYRGNNVFGWTTARVPLTASTREFTLWQAG